MVRVTTHPALRCRPTAQHFHPLSCTSHIEKMPRIFISLLIFNCHIKKTYRRSFAFLRKFFYLFFLRRSFHTKDVQTSSSDLAPPMEMVERTRKNTIFSIHFNQLKNRYIVLLILIVRLRRFLWRYFNDKCPERIVMRGHKSLPSQVDSLHSHTKRTRFLSLTCAHSEI